MDPVLWIQLILWNDKLVALVHCTSLFTFDITKTVLQIRCLWKLLDLTIFFVQVTTFVMTIQLLFTTK